MNNMSKFPTCDVCSKNLTNPPKILMTRGMDEIYRCDRCKIIVCAECNRIIWNRSGSDDSDTIINHCPDRIGSHNFSRFIICPYCGKIEKEQRNWDCEYEYRHIENFHHYIKCQNIFCNIIMRDREEQTKHLFNSQSCLDSYYRFGHTSLIKMLVKNIQTLQKEINELKRHSKNKKYPRNFKTEKINQYDEKSLREKLDSYEES